MNVSLFIWTSNWDSYRLQLSIIEQYGSKNDNDHLNKRHGAICRNCHLILFTTMDSVCCSSDELMLHNIEPSFEYSDFDLIIYLIIHIVLVVLTCYLLQIMQLWLQGGHNQPSTSQQQQQQQQRQQQQQYLYHQQPYSAQWQQYPAHYPPTYPTQQQHLYPYQWQQCLPFQQSSYSSQREHPTDQQVAQQQATYQHQYTNQVPQQGDEKEQKEKQYYQW
ncbi:MAG: hypothetical protein GY861_23360 [bacterium]|nr:hypothetical protein [bacterium]